jgi:pimeloyl-ACP methyl ester carboxylesterase
MHRISTTSVIFAVTLVASGCAASHQEVILPNVTPGISQVVFAVDGAGNFQASSKALRKAAALEHLPIQIETYEWSHGYGRIFADEIGHEFARAAGRRLAATVQAFLAEHPEVGISLVGHSAGTAVILTATESLPANSLEHIIFLAPSVSMRHDLRPALRAVRSGMDIYYSERDLLYLWLGVKLLGTADGQGRVAAGNVGFQPVIDSAEDATLYGRLRQHPWVPDVAWTGNWGGHYGSYREEYLQAYVLPVLTSNYLQPTQPH